MIWIDIWFVNEFICDIDLFANGNDFSWETIENNRNGYYQRKLANEISNEMNEVISLLTSTLNLNLNVGQNCQIDTSQVIMSLESKSSEFFSNSFQKSIGNGQINLPSNFSLYLNETTKVSIRVKLKNEKEMMKIIV